MKISRYFVPLISFCLLAACNTGEPGLDAEPCTAETESDGSVTIDCGSGGSSTIPAPESGAASVVNITEEGAGENCATGGQRIDYGVDEDQNGELDEEEIQGTNYICDGDQGPQGEDGTVALVRSSAEPSGENCQNGGQRIDSGLDTNGNGDLDADEITDTFYICNNLPPSQVRAGILHDLSLTDLEDDGWETCFLDAYATTDLNGDAALEDCDGDFLMMACRETDSDTITLAAADYYSVVTQEVEPDNTAHHVSGSVGWYYSPNRSWGFFEAGTDVNRSGCDILDDAGENRLCWHTDGAGGYRCGATKSLNINTSWERMLLAY